MEVGEKAFPESLHPELVAPCVMDCGLCIAHLRKRKRCSGCNGDDATKSAHCATCAIKTCGDRAAGVFCFECSRFPCARVRHIDRRYRGKYGMSMVENLERIQEVGIDAFVAGERVRWAYPECGGVLSVHRPACVYCGHGWDPSVVRAWLQAVEDERVD